jgi:hypothetical protein
MRLALEPNSNARRHIQVTVPDDEGGYGRVRDQASL